MADESKVDIDALVTFGQKMGDVLKTYGTATGPALSKAGAASVGLVGTNEAQTFRDWYDQAILEAAGKFMQDSTHAVQSFMYSSIIMAANYRTGDLSQAAALNDVMGAFDPKDGTPSIATEQAKADAEQHQLEAHLPPEDRTPTNGLPPAEIVDPPATKPGEQSPYEQVREHNDKYGKDEHWRPPDPNAPPDDPYDGSTGPVPGL